MDEPTRPAPPKHRAGPSACAPEWCVTLAFHPAPERIGHQFRQPLTREPWMLGRREPGFADPFSPQSFSSDTAGIAACGLEDQRISRAAFSLEPGSGGWVLRRPAGSSALRADGRDLGAETFLSDERLRRGVVLTLARCVVLHLQQRVAHAPEVANARPVPGMLGVSTAARRACREIHRAAMSGGDVLLLGPTGVGKDLAARAIHRGSERASAPWVAVNMAALPQELAAASLFGVRRGAYTGADRSRPGYFQQAAGGTLFLDEIGDTPPALQAQLLRALQDRELQVVGGRVETVDVRVIAATEQDPDAADSSFRSALRYRLAAHEIHLAPLAARREDIGLIAAAVCREAAQQLQRSWLPRDCAAQRLARWCAGFEALLLRDWPGNVRELRNGVAAMLRDDGELALPAPATAVCEEATEVAGTGAQKTIDDTRCPPGSRALASISTLSDREFLTAWQASDYEVARMARDFGVSRQSVYRRVQKLEQCRLATDVPLEELLGALQRCRGDLAATARGLAVSCAGLKQRLRNSALESQLRDLRSSRGVSRQTD